SSFLPKMTVGNETTNQLMGRLYTFNLDGPGDAVDRTHKMYAINPNNITDVIEIDLSGGAGNELGKNMKVNDWAFSPKNGFLYGYDESKDKILKINPKTGNIQDATAEVVNFSPPHMRGWPAAKDHRPPDNGNGT